MIRHEDNILIGISGGKDSLLLSLALATLKKRSPINFTLNGFLVDQTGGTMQTNLLSEYMNELGINFYIENHPTYQIIETREERSPCGLCANLRRGILASKAQELGCNVIALGHHKDDAAETVLLNLLYGGRFKCYHPHLYMSRTKMRVIRPLLYVEEKKIIMETKRLNLPIVNSCCPYGDKSKRKSTKELLQHIENDVPEIKSNLLHALKNCEYNDVWKDVLLNGELEKLKDIS
ncbi:MAG: ATP-binding protein [Synergistaceae bacterium]